jgi:hypothetical protein
MTQFLCTVDSNGNILCNGGYVVDLKAATSGIYIVGGTPTSLLTATEDLRTSTSAAPIFLGGGGGNVKSDSTITTTLSPVGWFGQTEIDEWTDSVGNKVIADFGAGTAEIVDPTNTAIATFSGSFTFAPIGTFTATTFGEDTYNGGTAFTLDISYDGVRRTSTANVLVSRGTAQGGEYPLTGFREWTNTTWLLTTNSDGTAQINDGTDDVATRSADYSPDSPSGTYASTAYGDTTYGDSQPFNMAVTLSPAFPKLGYVYVEIEKSGSNFTAVTGPFFSTSLPANSSTLEYVPIAYSDGSGLLIQIHEGSILWR